MTQRTAHERLTRICFIDYDREMALVAERADGKNTPEIVAVSRMSKEHGTTSAELAAIIRDEFHHKGLGSELFRRQLDIARVEGLKRVSCNMLAENNDIKAICKKLGFTVTDLSEKLAHAEITL